MATVWTCLVRIKGKDEARSHLIEKTSFTIGRNEDADLPLTEVSVSRKHLNVEMRGPQIFITDLKSGNGTSVNGQKIEAGVPIALTANDVIKIGNAPHEFQIISIPKPFEMRKEKVLASVEAEKIVIDARKDAEVIKTKALMDLQSKKQALESEIASLRQEAEMAASTERLKYAKDADQYLMEAQKKIAKDYEDASEYVETQLRATQEKTFSLLQDAEARARKTIQEAQEESSKIRLKATDEARQIHQDALKKHTATLASLQDSFHKDMGAKRQEIIDTAREDSLRDRARIMAEKAQEIETLTASVETVRSELTPLAERKAAAIAELKELDAITTQARKELERSNRDVDAVRKMLARMEDITLENATAEKDLAALQKRRDEAQAGIDKEIEDMRSRSILDFESSKKGQQTDLAKNKLKALEEIQNRIIEEEKRYNETRKMRVMELSQRISAKVVPSLEELMAEPTLAGARVMAAIEAATRESLLNETSSFQAPTLDELAPKKASKEIRSRRNTRIAMAAMAIAAGVIFVYGDEMYGHFKTQSNSYASERVEQRREASVYYPEKSPLFGETFRETYTDNVLYMKDYLVTKADSLNQQKWVLRLNDLDLLRPMGLTEDDMVAYTARENSMIERLGKLSLKINAMYEVEGIKELRTAEEEDVAEIKRIVKGDANYQRIRKLEKEFVTQLIRSR